MTRYLMRLTMLTAAFALIALPATAKEPVGASIEGGAIDTPLDLFSGGSGVGEGDLIALMSSARFFELVFEGQGLAAAPTEQTGEAYTITWEMGGSGGGLISQEVYLWAEGGPLVYIEPGQTVYDTKTIGGWMRASSELGAALSALGVPIDPPAPTTAAAPPATAAAPAVVVAEPSPAALSQVWVIVAIGAVLVTLGAVGFRRRPREAG